MESKHILSRLTLFLGLSLASAQAATLYVSTSGSDSNPGTSSQPFRTITYAYSKASAGTTILVAPGTYTDFSSGWGWHLNKSGTASSPIVLKSQVRGGAILDSQYSSSAHHGIYLDGSYNVVDGFGITRAPITGVYLVGSNNQIINNEIYNNSVQGSSDPEGQGIYSEDGTSGNVYMNNYIHDNGFSGSNLDHGLYLCGHNEVVANNVVVRHPSRGLQLAGYSSVSNTKVYNNVFAYNGKHGITVWMAMNAVDIRNNICFQNGLYGVQFYDATGSGVTLDHNLVYGNGSGNYSLAEGTTTVSYSLGTTISSDPKFANETRSGIDAHLASGSPAIGAGVNEYSTITTDFAGAARPSSGAWDLGAYVYGSTTSSNVAPPTVAMTSPGNGSTVSGSSVSVTANASSSGSSIASVQFKLDGQNLGAALTAAPYARTWDSTAASDGNHTVTAVATDAAGNSTTATAVTVLVSNAVAPSLPTVTVAATTPNASRVGPANGKFTITRAGSTNAALTVNITLSGSAVNGVDYSTLGTSVTIPAGSASATVTIVPRSSSTLVDTTTAALTLATNSNYTIGSAKSGLVSIAGNSLRSTIRNVTGQSLDITWDSVSGKTYAVACKSSLTDTNWTNMNGAINATSTTTAYTDATIGNSTSRFYIVYVKN